ncbi:MAG: hypothetical protein ACW98X_17140 [Promethearchaeota archaeon]
MALSDLLQFPHFYVMIIAVIFLSISVILVTVHKPKKWFYLHIICSTTGTLLTIVGVILLMGLNLTIPHAILGLIAIIFLIGELLGGFIARKTKNKKIRTFHLWASRIIYIVVLIAVILGIINFI